MARRKILSPQEYDSIYYSDDNWAGALTDEDRENLERHREIIGPPIVDGKTADGKKFDPHDVAAKLRSLMDRVERLARKRFVGEGVIPVIMQMLQAIIFGANCHVEGSSGVAKSEALRFLAVTLDFPISEIDATADISDLMIVGGEVPKAGMEFNFNRGPVSKPGTMVVKIDEARRLPGSATTALLQAMTLRELIFNLVATGRGNHRMLLSHNFSVMNNGNPVWYGAQGEISLAYWDRILIGLFMTQPTSAERVIMYERAETSWDFDPMAPMRSDFDPAQFTAPMDFTLREVHAALNSVTIDPEHRKRIEAASFAISPENFRTRVGWKNSPFFTAIAERLGRRELASLKHGLALVEDNLLEGSNPRGEIAVVKNSQALALLDGRFKVRPKHLRLALMQANRARLKVLPGCENEVEPILARAVELFFADGDAAPAEGGDR